VSLPTTEADNRAGTGIAGFDNILNGGFVRDRLYLLEGNPGTGKTTLALQFLLEGARVGERGLCITLSETAEEMRAAAASHGWSLEGIEIVELAPAESLLDAEQQQSLLYSSDLELGETTKLVFEAVERVKPHRVALDSLSEIRLLAQGSLRYRRQILALKHYFARHRATVVMLDDLTSDDNDRATHSIAHGVIKLEELAPEYGAERRRLRVTKYRGTPFRGGYHDFTIQTGGVAVYPRLVAAEHRREFAHDPLRSGIAPLDALLGGGLTRGSSTLITGPAGVGKTLLALHFAMAEIENGQRAALYIFDEEIGLLLERAHCIGLDLAAHQSAGNLIIVQIDPAELTPGAFAHRVRHDVETKNVGTILIDSLNGYQVAMPEENYLILHMHELLAYLNRHGVVSILTLAQHGLLGETRAPVDLTYLSDTILLIRYFETRGRICRALSVVKKRGGSHENTVREYRVTPTGLAVGPVLTAFQGILRGVPEFLGSQPGLEDTGDAPQ
jgi:circadian clock protein KaiC